MTNVVSQEVIEEVRRQKIGQPPAPKVRLESVQFRPTSASNDEMARLLGTLIMAMQGYMATHQVGAA
jgi:hypothetical protein